MNSNSASTGASGNCSTISLDSIPRHSPDTASRVVDGEALIVRLSDNVVMILNAVGSRIWELVDGRRSLRAIVGQIQTEFDAELDVLERDALTFTEELVERRLLTVNS